jgi:phosphoribosylaminoimidazolecarboxamide formyltransferase/IMP cyclohydrolase
MTDRQPLRRALLSVSDKTGLTDLAQALSARGVDLVSTGGTAKTIRDAGMKVTDVSDLTGFPEMMDGRVKTLHPGVHGGLLALRDDEAHLAAMKAHGIAPIDLLVVNLYPFEETVARGAGYDETIENIDIGGPAMIRAASKNHAFVTVLTDTEDYKALLSELDANGGQTTLSFRQRQAQIAYARTAAYDAAISNWMAGALEMASPRRRVFAGTFRQAMRYGENPHQGAALYADASTGADVLSARQVQGKELSYNNINDADGAWGLLAEFADGPPACVIVKHANPCGVALGESPAQAFRRAFDCDRTSAFGGIVALNKPIDRETAEAITEIFTEIVIAPGADDEAIAIFAAKKNLRLLLTDGLPDPRAARLSVRQVAGGWLVQDHDVAMVGEADLKTVTGAKPNEGQIADLLFAWKVAKHVKSNAIVYARDGQTVGIGAGQMSRIDSARIAARKAQDMAEAMGLETPLTVGSVVASDAFFPFPDGLMVTAEAGAVAVIQPGGSMRDDAVIEAADNAGLAMVFTGQRHFRH